MPVKIDRDLLAVIKIEFESSLKPGLVYKHLSRYDKFVFRKHIYRLYDR